MTYRPYSAGDRAACLAIFDSNAARFFSPGDRADFERFLDDPPGVFGVLCDDSGRIVGCGGVGLRPGTTHAVLTWGMIHADRQQRGYGKLLAQERLHRLQQLPDATKVMLHTGQETRGFYEKLGFQVASTAPNGYRPGLDRIEMELPL